MLCGSPPASGDSTTATTEAGGSPAGAGQGMRATPFRVSGRGFNWSQNPTDRCFGRVNPL